MNRSLKLFLALVSLCMTTFCFAQKSELQFNKDGKFKIVQFTDVHFKYKNPASDIALERINQVLDEEQPDFESLPVMWFILLRQTKACCRYWNRYRSVNYLL